MREEVVKALKGSIEKWKKVAAGKASDEGPNNCPLCQLFFTDGCERCPVYEITGTYLCEGTPYDEWSAHQLTCHNHGTRVTPGCEACVRAATAEINS